MPAHRSQPKPQTDRHHQPINLQYPPNPSELVRSKSKRLVSRPLQRNQACSTCRSRKVRCDAKKPACGACVRSALAHGFNQDVVCHYEFEPDPIHSFQPLPIEPTNSPGPSDLTQSQDHLSVQIASLEDQIAQVERLISEFEIQPPPSSQSTTSHLISLEPSSSSNSREVPIDVISSNLTPLSNDPIPNSTSSLISSDWPNSLPPRSIVNSVLEIYFSHRSGSGQVMFIESDLQSSLHLPTTDPRFPFVGLIHSIMAITFQTFRSDSAQLISLIHRSIPYGSPSQTLDQYHAECAKINIEEALGNSCYLFQSVQAVSIFCHYAYNVGRLVEAYVYSGIAVRFATLLGLNYLEDSPAYETGEKPKPQRLLPPPRSTIEKYTRSTTFWYVFQTDRLLSVSSGRAHSIEETDISTFLPSLDRPSDLRLSISHPQFFSTQADDGSEEESIQQIRGVILLGRVSSWLRRANDPVGFNLRKRWRLPIDRNVPDLRSQSDFIILDQQIQCLQSQTRPLQTIDGSQVLSNLIPSLSTILLHECFITTGDLDDRSYQVALRAANLIADHAYHLLAIPDLDFHNLHPFTNFCWAVAARMITRSMVLRPKHHTRDQQPDGIEEVYVLMSAMNAQAEISNVAQAYGRSVTRALERRDRIYGGMIRLVKVENGAGVDGDGDQQPC